MTPAIMVWGFFIHKHMAIVYQHTRLDTNKVFYIGIGKTEKRAYNTTNHRNSYWKNIINKTEYKIEILFNDLTWKEACQIEQYLIKYYGRKDLKLGTLVNMTDGGDGSPGLVFTEEHKNKISLAHKGKIRSVQARENMSRGKKGIIFSDEHIQNMKISSRNSFKNGRIPGHIRKVIDVKTNIIYNSIASACKNLNLKYSATVSQICGQNPNKTTLKYITW